MTTYRIKRSVTADDGLYGPNMADVDVPSIAKAKTKARKVWTKTAEEYGVVALVRVELFAVDSMTRSEKPVAKLEGRWPDVPHWRNF